MGNRHVALRLKLEKLLAYKVRKHNAEGIYERQNPSFFCCCEVQMFCFFIISSHRAGMFCQELTCVACKSVWLPVSVSHLWPSGFIDVLSSHRMKLKKW